MPPISARVVFALFAILTIALFAPAQAQDGTAAEPLQESLVEVDDLEVQLLPLRRDELAAAAEEWISRLRDKVQALSSVEIAARQSTDADEKLSLQARAAELRTERSALIDRVDVVLRALKEKGGDTEELEQYVDAVSGIVLDVTDTSAAWINIRTWLESPEGGIKLGLNIIKFIVTLVAFWILAIVVSNLVRKALSA